MSQDRCEGSQMSCEATALIRSAAEVKPGDSVKTVINRVARTLRWKYSRTFEIWYGRARRIDAHEMDALRQEAQKQAAHYEKLAHAMRAADPDFYQPEIAALVWAARRLRGAADTGNGGA